MMFPVVKTIEELENEVVNIVLGDWSGTVSGLFGGGEKSDKSTVSGSPNAILNTVKEAEKSSAGGIEPLESQNPLEPKSVSKETPGGPDPALTYYKRAIESNIRKRKPTAEPMTSYDKQLYTALTTEDTPSIPQTAPIGSGVVQVPPIKSERPRVQPRKLG